MCDGWGRLAQITIQAVHRSAAWAAAGLLTLQRTPRTAPAAWADVCAATAGTGHTQGTVTAMVGAVRDQLCDGRLQPAGQAWLAAREVDGERAQRLLPRAMVHPADCSVGMASCCRGGRRSPVDRKPGLKVHKLADTWQTRRPEFADLMGSLICGDNRAAAEATCSSWMLHARVDPRPAAAAAGTLQSGHLWAA